MISWEQNKNWNKNEFVNWNNTGRTRELVGLNVFNTDLTWWRYTWTQPLIQRQRLEHLSMYWCLSPPHDPPLYNRQSPIHPAIDDNISVKTGRYIGKPFGAVGPRICSSLPCGLWTLDISYKHLTLLKTLEYMFRLRHDALWHSI